jgi:hypothetical protein
MTDSMRDWPKMLRVNNMAAQLAPALYHCRALLYDPDSPPWVDASPQIHLLYIEIAERVLRELAPKNEPSSTGEPAQKPQIVKWCPKCGTRQQSRHEELAPYCSHLCRDAAQWQERTRI